MNEWMNKLYFTKVVEKTRGLFTSSPRPWGKLLLTKDTVSYSVLSTCTFIQFMLMNGHQQIDKQADNEH